MEPRDGNIAAREGINPFMGNYYSCNFRNELSIFVLVFFISWCGCENGVIVDGDVTVSAALTREILPAVPERVVVRVDIGDMFGIYGVGVICRPLSQDLVAPFRYVNFGCRSSGSIDAWLVAIDAKELATAACDGDEEKSLEMQLLHDRDGPLEPPDGAPYDSVTVFEGTSGHRCRDGEATVHLVLEK